MSIEMHPVLRTTNILEFGYDDPSATLRVKFAGYLRQKDGVQVPPRVYDYDNVERDHYEAMLEANRNPAKSVGRYFHTHVRSGTYRVRQIEEPT